MKKYWENFWYLRQECGSQNDPFFQKASINAIAHVLNSCDNLLILGCGDGFGIEKYSEKASNITGIDYSESAIKKARGRYSAFQFLHGNILQKQFQNDQFDAVISERCLCNLASVHDQVRIFGIVHDYLRKNGQFIVCEPWLQGYDAIDKIRAAFSLEPLKRHWHNILLDDDIITKSGFEIAGSYTFGIYSLISRIFHPVYVYPEEPRFNNRINEIGSLINNETMFLDDFAHLPSQHILYNLLKR